MQLHAKTFGQPKTKTKGKFSKILQSLGRIGKALMFPIAVLPVAAIFLRLGAQIPGGTPFAFFIQQAFLAAGNTVFDNLYLLFGVGVAFGLTKDNRGEAALVGLVGIILLTVIMGKTGADLTNQIYGKINFELPNLDSLKSGRFGVPAEIIAAGDEAITNWALTNLTGFHRLFGTSYDSILSKNVLNGIVTGGIVAFLYNRFNGIELPSALGFFSGRRLIPILGVIAILFFGFLWAIIFPWIGYVLYLFSDALTQATGDQYAKAGISGVYAILNRLLIPFGLHHVPNTFFWFVFGNHDAIGGGQVYGDINIFLKGVPENNTSGAFQTGFFPTMMFGLPAIVYAFYKTAETKGQKQKVLSLFAPLAAVSFLTGITEPIEFAFMFVSPILYAAYALLTGVFAFIINLFGIQLGFGFSAGLLDYLLSIPKSMEIIAANKTGVAAVFANPAWLWPIGAVAAATFYFVAKTMIVKLNLSTPGRGANFIQADENLTSQNTVGQLSHRGQLIVAGLGGWDNIANYQNCSTRLRYDVKNLKLVDESILKKANLMGIQKVGNQMQLIIGPTVEILNNEIQAHIGESIDIDKVKPVVNAKTTATTVTKAFKPFSFKSPISGKVVALSTLSDPAFKAMGQGIAIIPKAGDFKVYDDELVQMGFHTGHAYILEKNGISILIHIGLDTNKLLQDEKAAAKVFNSRFAGANNTQIKKNNLLVKVDLAEMKKRKLVTTTPIIVMNETLANHKVKLVVKPNTTVKAGDVLFKVE